MLKTAMGCALRFSAPALDILCIQSDHEWHAHDGLFVVGTVQMLLRN